MAYKVIFRDENLGWQRGCPVGILAVQVSRNTETAECFLQTKVRNLSRLAVGKVELQATVSNEAGQTEEVTITELDADVAPGAGKALTPQKLGMSEVATVQVKVMTADGVSYEDVPMLPVPARVPFEMPFDLMQERLTALRAESPAYAEDMTSYALTIEDGWWVCPCGAINVGRGTCHQCGCSKDRLFNLQTKEGLEAEKSARLQNEALAAAANAEKEQAQAEQRARNRSALKKVLLVALPAIILLLGSSVYYSATRKIYAPVEVYSTFDNTTTTLEYENGVLTGVIDDGDVTAVECDGRGRIVSFSWTDSSGGNATGEVAYNADGTIEVVRTFSDGDTMPSVCDRYGNETSTLMGQGTDTEIEITSEDVVDSKGNVTSSTVGISVNGTLMSSPSTYTYENTYDENDLLTSIVITEDGSWSNSISYEEITGSKGSTETMMVNMRILNII